MNGENQVLRALKDMKANQLESSIARKYENTITFVEQTSDRYRRAANQALHRIAAPARRLASRESQRGRHR